MVFFTIQEKNWWYTHPITIGIGGPNTKEETPILVDANGPTTWTATGGGKSNMRSTEPLADPAEVDGEEAVPGT